MQSAAPIWSQHGKHVFIFSAAGKPIFSRYAEDSPATFEVSSILSAVAGRTLQSGDPVSCIVTPTMRMTFLMRPPLFLVAVSRTNDTQHALIQLLEALYSNILLAVTAKVIDRLAHRPSMDIRQFLTGSRPSFLNLLRLSSRAPTVWLDAIPCLPVSPSSRSKVTSILASAANLKPVPGAAPGSSPGGDGVLYAMLIAGYQVVGWAQMRPSRGMTPLRPHDLMLLTSLVQSSASVRQSDAWTPVCLPGVDPSGYLHAYISYLGATYVHRGRPGSLSTTSGRGGGSGGGGLNASFDGNSSSSSFSAGGGNSSAGWGRGRAMSFGGLSRSNPLAAGSPGSPSSVPRPVSSTPLSQHPHRHLASPVSPSEGLHTPGGHDHSSGGAFHTPVPGATTFIPPRSGTATGPSRRRVVTPELSKGGSPSGEAAAASVIAAASPVQLAPQEEVPADVTPPAASSSSSSTSSADAPVASATAETVSAPPSTDGAAALPTEAPAPAPPAEASAADAGPKIPRHRLMLAAAAKAVAEGTVGKQAPPAMSAQPALAAASTVTPQKTAASSGASSGASPAEPPKPAGGSSGSPAVNTATSPRQGAPTSGRVAATAASYPLAFLASPPPKRSGATAGGAPAPQPPAAPLQPQEPTGGDAAAAAAATYDIDGDPPAIFLVVVSAHTHPDHLASLAARKATMVRELHESGCFYHVLRALAGAGPTGVGDYAASVFGVPGVLHLLYVWKPLRQYTMAKLPPLASLHHRCSIDGGSGGVGTSGAESGSSAGPAAPWPHNARKALLRAYQRVYDELTRPSPVLRHYLSSFECDVVWGRGEAPAAVGATLAGLQTTNALIIALWDAHTPAASIPAAMEKLAKVIRKDHDKLLVMTPGKF